MEVLRAAASLFAICLGTGVLCLPYAAQQVHLGFGLFFLGLVAYLACESLDIVCQLACKYRAKTYGDLIQKVLEMPYLATFIDVVVSFDCVGATVGYFIFAADLLTDICSVLWPNSGEIRLGLTLGFTLMILPLCTGKPMKVLGYLSFSGALAVGLLAVVMVVRIDRAGPPDIRERQMVKPPSLVALSHASSIYFFSFLCHS